MRCLALAQALIDAGHMPMLATAEIAGSVSRRFSREGVEVLSVDAEKAGQSRDGVATRDLALTHRADWLVVDGYGFDNTYLAAIAGPWRILLIDDLGRDGVEVAMVLNQNPYALPQQYPARDPDCELLLGPRYALLRREFRDAPPTRSIRPQAQNILVSLGGSDADNVTLRVVRALAGVTAQAVRVVLGGSHPDPASVEEAAGVAGFEVLREVESMPALLEWADLVIGAGGTSALEYAYAGLPSILLALADNQVPVVESLARANVVAPAGRPDDGLEVRLRDEVDSLLADHERRESMADIGRSLVDGRGVDRLLARMARPQVVLRPARADDARLLFEWSNDPIVRTGSFDSRPIVWEDHLAWLDARLNDPQSRIWIAESGGIPVGVTRFAIDGDRATISVTVAPEWRGKGMGEQLISLATGRLLLTERTSTVDAWIRPENTASVRAFEAAGYRRREPPARPGETSRDALLLSLETAARR